MEDKLKNISDKINLAKDIFEKVDLQNQLAWELRLSNPRQALVISDQSYQWAKGENYTKGLAESLKNQCFVYNTLSNYDLSFQKAIEALELFRKSGDKGEQAAIISILGNNSYLIGDYENALKYHLLALPIREELNDTSGVINSLISIGNIYGVKKDYDNSLKHYLNGLAMVKSLSGTHSSEVILLGNIGSNYANKRQYDKALEYYFEAAKLEHTIKDMTATSNCTNIAEVYFVIGDLENSEKYSSMALEKAIATENKQCEALALLGLGKIANKLGKGDKAMQYLEKSLTAAESGSLKWMLPDIFLSLSDACSQKKDFVAALNYHKKFYVEKEQQFNEESEKNIRNLLILHQVETLKKESELHRISNEELKKLNEEVENTNRRIMESIDYAKHIQDSILPHPGSLKQYFSDSFVFHRPKDIISGDFFWMFEKENDIIIAAVDCTGHSVSGALMSVVANSVLNQVTSNLWMPNPSFILNEVNHYMERTLSAHDDSGLRDSMDIALVSINKTKTELLFTGAHNSLYLISDGVLTEYKGDNISLGNGTSAKFTTHRIKLKKGDCIYIFTDGYADQKGGNGRKKFYYPPFKDLILEIHSQSMEKQKILLEKTMDEWMGAEKQIDDMLIIGVKI